MKRFSHAAGPGLMLALAMASPSLAAKPKTAAQPADTSPVVTPDTTAPPSGYAAPTGTVQVGAPGSTAAPAQAYSVPIGGAPQPQAPAAPAGPPPPAVMARAELCLRNDAQTAARAEQSAKLAVDLLLEDLCASEVDAAAQYVRNVMALAQYNPTSERGRAGLSTAHVDPDTGQIIAPPNVDVSGALEAAAQGDLKIAAELRRYAAELVLAERARLAASASRPANPTTAISAKAAPAKKTH